MALLYDISKTLAEKYHGGILSETPEHDISYFSGFVVAAYGEVKRKRLQEKRKEAKENRSYNRLNDFVELNEGPVAGTLQEKLDWAVAWLLNAMRQAHIDAIRRREYAQVEAALQAKFESWS